MIESFNPCRRQQCSSPLLQPTKKFIEEGGGATTPEVASQPRLNSKPETLKCQTLNPITLNA